jgi:hypothetical protein
MVPKPLNCLHILEAKTLSPAEFSSYAILFSILTVGETDEEWRVMEPHLPG